MTTTPAPRQANGLDRFFDTLRRSPVTRSHNRVVAGVAGGIAERLGIAPAVIRLGLVVLALLGPGIALYLVAWLMLPDAQGRVRLESAIRDGDGASVTLLVIAALAIIPDFFGHAHFGPFPFIALAILGVVGYKKGWWHRMGSSTSPSSTTQPTQPTTPQDAPRY